MRRNNVFAGILLVMSMMLLSCCADSSTHGTQTDKEYDTRITINNGQGGTVTFSTPINVEADSKSDTKQETAGTSTVSPQTKAMLTDGGSTGSMATDGAAPILKDIVSQIAPKTTTTTATTTNTPTTNTTNSAGSNATKPATPAATDEPADDTTSEGTETTTDLGAGVKYNLSSSDGGYKTLRTKETGAYFGKSLKFVYENGYTVTISDTSKRYEEGSRQTIYRCGGKGLSQSDERYTSHGGMGIWTKKAGGSSTVVMYVLQK